VEDSEDVDDDEDEDGDVDIEEKQLVAVSTEMEGVEDPATETVSMFRVMVSAVGWSPSLLRLPAPRRRARGDSSNLTAEQVVCCDVVRPGVDLGGNSDDGTAEGRTTLRDI
jgi:hypothetical protein